MIKKSLALSLIVLVLVGCASSQSHFITHQVVENITGVKFPKYKVVSTESSPRSFNGDGSDRFTLEFAQIPGDDFYTILDQNQDFFKWSEDGRTTYSFERIWGNGLPAPQGESDNDDYNFKVKIEKGSQEFYIEVATW